LVRLVLLGGLTTWFLADAAGPWLVERGLDGLRGEDGWSDQLLHDLVDLQGLQRSKKKQLRRWLQDENVLEALVANDRPGCHR
jgi:hypothetical protein